jgi:hypothetical protein
MGLARSTYYDQPTRAVDDTASDLVPCRPNPVIGAAGFWPISGQFSADHHEELRFHPSYRHENPRVRTPVSAFDRRVAASKLAPRSQSPQIRAGFCYRR